ncbi:hypothetical protein CF70_018035 [Cupriavidus sp. SK-3]|nr:hypothetical protein CF70_018035 [Cupriavidus sp. SK-3]
MSVNGAAAVFNSLAGNVPVVDRFRLGAAIHAGGDYFNGSIQHFNYIPVRKANAELAPLSMVQ